jgi:phosphoribosylformimino-5-aminoimidazole carboxamide ribotide isomerase
VKFIPAIDLKNNKCVRLQKGRLENMTVFNNDPVKQAIFFEEKGCKRIHIVDLDAAFGSENVNKNIILEIRKNINIPLQLGGGIKNEEDISFWLKSGIDFLIIGSLAVKNKKLILDLSKKYPNKIYIALDVLKQKIMINGWKEDSNLLIDDILKVYNGSSVNGFVLTDISRDGMLEGLDISLINDFVSRTSKKIIVGGGLSNYQDLYRLKEINSSKLEGVIAGKSYYSGSIEIHQALEILKINA